MYGSRIITLLVTCVLVTAIAFGGPTRKVKRDLAPKTITGDEFIPGPPVSGPGNPTPFIGPGTIVGVNSYDYGSNGSANHNIVNGAVNLTIGRMTATGLTAGYPNRDDYYDCNSGGGWTGSLTRIGTVRTGWAGIDELDGKNIIVSHTGALVEVDRQNVACSKLAADWTTTTYGAANNLWPRIAVTGTTDLHVIYGNANPPTAILYTRSTNSGSTFDIVGGTIATAGTYVADADAYDIASQGTNLAVVLAGFGGDLILVQSTDEGTTWGVPTVIKDVDETFLTDDEIPDGSCAVAYDNLGNVHVVWGTYYVNGGGPDSVFYSLNTGINHWSTNTGTIQEIALPPADIDFLTTVIFRDGGLASGPDLAIDASNNICVVYSSFILENDASGNTYEHVFGVGSPDDGATWDTEVELTPGTLFDATFPSVASLADADVHIVYTSDPLAGSSVQLAHAISEANTMYLAVPKTDFDPLSCNDITSVGARCIGGGTKTVQVRVNLLGDNSHAGETVTITIDEDVYVGAIITNGTHSRANFSIAGVYTTGDHIVTVIDPSGCGLAPKHATCAASDGMAKADPEWDDDAEWLGNAQDVPQATKLLGNYPNPFNPSTSIQYALGEETHVTLKVYNTLGQEVATLVNDIQSAGYKTAIWNGKNDSGSPVASGLYIYTLKAGNVVKSERMLLMK